MTDVYKPPFAPLPSVTAMAYDAAAVTALQGRLNAIIALFDVADGDNPAHPDFNHIPKAAVELLSAELAAMRDQITAH